MPDLVSSTESVNSEDHLSIPHATPFTTRIISSSVLDIKLIRNQNHVYFTYHKCITSKFIRYNLLVGCNTRSSSRRCSSSGAVAHVQQLSCSSSRAAAQSLGCSIAGAVAQACAVAQVQQLRCSSSGAQQLRYNSSGAVAQMQQLRCSSSGAVAKAQ